MSLCIVIIVLVVAIVACTVLVLTHFSRNLHTTQSTEHQNEIVAHEPIPSYQPKLLMDEQTKEILSSIFSELTKLTVDSSGLIHHCSQYDVTLIIPEGAVQQSATVWFGACLFSDKFQFEGDYVPVTPIVWVYIDCELVNEAELYLPHYIDTTSSDVANDFIILAADDESIMEGNMCFRSNTDYLLQDAWEDSTTLNVLAKHFCSLCGAVDREKHKQSKKKFLMMKAEKREGNDIVYADICLLYLTYRKTVETQYQNNGYVFNSYNAVFEFEERQGRISLSFDPETTPNWTRTFMSHHRYISADQIDFVVDGGALLKQLEDELSYPPRFRLKFQKIGADLNNDNIHVRLDGTADELIIPVNLESTDQKNLKEAMKEGSVEFHITKAVVQGEARAGKTSFKCLLLHLPYDELSTSCVEASQLAFCTHRFGRVSDGERWKPVKEEEFYDMVIAELQLITEEKVVESTSNHELESIANTELEFTANTEQSHAVRHDTLKPILEPKPTSKPETTLEPQSMSPVLLEANKAVHSRVNELIEKCQSICIKGSGLSLRHDWLYFIDSGGQIQFQKLLPVFMPFASHLILVLNLAKNLSDQSSTAMQLCDRQIKCSKHSLSTVEEIFRQLISAIALSTEKFNTLITQDSVLRGCVRRLVDELNVIAVATHGDKLNDQLVETPQDKERALNDICSSMKCKLERGNTSGSHCDILYHVDGRKAESGEFDDPVVMQIAEKLQNQAYKIKVPIKWYCFWAILHKTMAEDGMNAEDDTGTKNRCGILSLSKCQEIGMQLQIPKREVVSALKFFHFLNMLLYYPDSPMADMVFVQVDSLIDIIRELVILACSDHRRAEADVKELVTKGYLSVRVLKRSEKYRKISSAFDCKFGEKLLSLFEHLLIAVRLPDDKHTYFMPALLSVSEVKDINPEEPPPLLFYFENAVPMGLFCTTIVYLSKVFSWHVIGTVNYSNYVTLQNDKNLKEIILVERIDCIEVRAKFPDAQIARHIEETIHRHGKSYKKAFYCSFHCEDHGTRHKAVVDSPGNDDVRVRCSSEKLYKLDEGMSCWFKETVSTGSSAVLQTPHNSKSTAAEQEYIAYNILRSNTSRIKKSMIGLSYLADKLAEKEIISEDEKRQVTRDSKSGLNEDERMDQLLDALKATVKVDGSYFGWFIEILRDRGTVLTKKLASDLLTEYTDRLQN